VELGKYVMECWYFSPFPKEYFPDGYADRLYFCEYSLAFFRHKSELIRWHQSAKPPPHPPGNEIYRSGSLAMFEVDGAEQTFYCQNLCYLAKLFLDHKTLYYDVDPFLFYILCEVDERGFHIVGYFSKEKYSDLGYNLACILIFPAHQRKGYGRFLISFSYELSKKEEKVGSPEKPLSDLGAVSYRSYWASVILACLSTWKEESISIMDVSKATSIMSDDVSNTLQFLGLLRYKGGQHVIVADKEQLKLLRIKYPIKEPAVDAGRLHWAPLITDQKKDKFHIRSKRAPEAEPDDGG
jgi:histone acetyltransferase MYST1